MIFLFLPRRRTGGFWRRLPEFSKRLGNREASVIQRIVLLARPVIRNLLNDGFRIIASSNRTFGKRPIVFRLRQSRVARLAFYPGLIMMPGRFLGVGVKLEIPQVVGLAGVLTGFHVKVRPVFLVRESWQSENTCSVRRRRVAAKLACQRMEQGLGLGELDASTFQTT